MSHLRIPKKRRQTSTTPTRAAYESWLLPLVAAEAGRLIDLHPSCPPPINRQVDVLTALRDQHLNQLRSGAIR